MSNARVNRRLSTPYTPQAPNEQANLDDEHDTVIGDFPVLSILSLAEHHLWGDIDLWVGELNCSLISPCAR